MRGRGRGVPAPSISQPPSPPVHFEINERLTLTIVHGEERSCGVEAAAGICGGCAAAAAADSCCRFIACHPPG